MFNSFLSDFHGRRPIASAIIVGAIGSASLNIYGAFQTFPNVWTGVIVAVVIGAAEYVAAFALPHIVTDFQNNRFWKARLASFIWAVAVAGCVLSGKQAFNVLFLEADATHASLEKRATARQQDADVYHARMLAGTLDVSDRVATARWEAKQETADNAKLKELKAKPPHEAVVYLLLTLFETMKIGGLFALATPSTPGRTKGQLKADKRRAKISERESLAKYKSRIEALKESDNVTQIAA